MTPEERDAIIQRADELRINGDYESAAPLYDQVLAENDRDHTAMLGRAYCQLNTGLFDEAIESFSTARDIDPDHIKGRVELAKCLAMLAMYPEAKKEFKAVLALDPENDDAHEQLEYFPDDDEDEE